MNDCPFCGHHNLAGADECAHCQQPLVFLSKPRPRTFFERSLMKDNVAALGPREPMLVHADTAVGEVIRRMVNWKVGSVLVVDGKERLVGIFTERDALLRIGSEVSAVEDSPVSQFMTPGPLTISEDDPIAQALHKMDLLGCRHLPVMRGGRVTGVVSVRDILQYCATQLLPEPV